MHFKHKICKPNCIISLEVHVSPVLFPLPKELQNSKMTCKMYFINNSVSILVSSSVKACLPLNSTTSYITSFLKFLGVNIFSCKIETVISLLLKIVMVGSWWLLDGFFCLLIFIFIFHFI